MSESNRQTRPSVQVQGGASVPVLFALKNVQPKIVGSIANGGAASVKAGDVADLGSVKTNVTSAPVVSNTPVKPKAPQNRAYNIAVSLLFFAVCLLVIRNSQANRSSSADSIAAGGVSSATTTNAKPEVDTKAIAANSAKPEMAPFELSAPPSLIPTLTASNSPTPSATSNDLELPPSNASIIASSSTTDSPRVPPLLTSAKTEVVRPTEIAGATSSQVETNSVETNSLVELNAASQTSLSFPDARLAANPNQLGPANAIEPSASTPVPGSGKSANEPLNISSAKANGENEPLATNAPSYTTRQLIDMRERSLQTSASNLVSEQPNLTATFPTSMAPSGTANSGIIATPISNVTTMPVNSPTRPTSTYRPLENDSQILNGKPYPSLPKEAAPLIIPQYEQNLPAGRVLGPEPPQSLQSIRQPATTQPVSNQSGVSQPTSSGNRYQPLGTQLNPQTPAQPVPYTPIPQPQSGNSFGYPPTSSGY